MKIEYIDINEINKIPVYLFSTVPKILVIAGIHGNEKTGVVILKKIIKQFKNSNRPYSVAIIPCVNLPAYRANLRVNPNDKIDLNRIFPATEIKSQSYLMAKKIQDFAKKFTVVIDLHVFTGQYTLTCGVDLNIANRKINKKIKQTMSQLELDAICRIDHVSEPKKDGSLCAYLQRQNILAFGIELPPLEVLTKTNSKNIIRGLTNLIKDSNKSIGLRKINSYIRLQYFSKYTGYFSPKKVPGLEIKKGDIMGILTKRDKKTLAINSPFNGRLISISYKKFVKMGNKLFVVGKNI